MEKHKYHGIIVTEIKRPARAVVDGFAKHEVCKIGDAMGGAGVDHAGVGAVQRGDLAAADRHPGEGHDQK